MEISTGFIGIKQYLGFLLGNVTPFSLRAINACLCVALFFLLYRRIESVANITMWLWIGTMLTALVVIAGGLTHFDAKIAFDFPDKAFNFSLGFLSGLGAATSIGVYDYLGYYETCYIGDEVRNPGRVVPRSILLSLAAAAVIYLSMNLSMIGVLPWRSIVAAPGADPAPVGSLFVQKIWGSRAAWIFTVLVLWTTFGSIFTLALGYSRVPYAAARDGCFFPAFGRPHATKDFPHLGVILVVGLSVAFSFIGLGTLIYALLALRILVQFIAQIGALMLLRRARPDMPRPFRLWLYPLPALAALGGWCFVFVTTERKLQLGAIAALAAGVAAFLIWTRRTGAWPFQRKA